MASQSSPINYINIDLEIEAIQQFRRLVPFLSPDCRVFRELKGDSTILCLDFAACPQELQMSEQEWLEWAELLVFSSHYLGLANSLLFKIGERTFGKINLSEIVNSSD